MENILSLKGRIALVTGAGQGIGRQIALHFAAHGATVLVNDFYAERAQSVVGEITALGAMALPVVCDVTDFVQVSHAIDQAVAAAGGLHIVVNNAGNAGTTDGLEQLPPFWETGPDIWNKWLGTNLFGVLNVSRSTIPMMIKTGVGGSIVNIISDAGRVGEPHLAVYSAAKAGASGFSRALAKALGAHAIRVNSVSLGGVRTPGLQGLIPTDEATLKKSLRSYIIRRIGEPEDAANMVLFLASDASSWVTGQTYGVNGGYSTSQ